METENKAAKVDYFNKLTSYSTDLKYLVATAVPGLPATRRVVVQARRLHLPNLLLK